MLDPERERILKEIQLGLQLGYLTEEQADKLKMDAFAPGGPVQPSSAEAIAAAVSAVAETTRRERNREAWLDDKERAMTNWSSVVRMAESSTLKEDLNAEFHRRAQHGHLSPDEVAALSILLREESFERGGRMLAAFLLRVPTEKKTRVYNWAVVDSFQESSTWELVERAEKLQLPFFPEELNELNVRLANAVACGDNVAARELYRAGKDSQLVGGGYLPVYGADGAQIGVTDNTENEKYIYEALEKFATLVGNLERKVAQLASKRSQSGGGSMVRDIRQRLEEVQKMLDAAGGPGEPRGGSATPRRGAYAAAAQPPAANRAVTPRRSGSATRQPPPRYNGGGEDKQVDNNLVSYTKPKN